MSDKDLEKGEDLGCRSERQELIPDDIVLRNWTNPPLLDAEVLEIAKRCRMVVQRCLREDEWLDADEAFFAILRPCFGTPDI